MKKPVHFQKFARNRRAERTERQGAGGISKFLFWGEDLSGSFQGAGGVGGLVAHMEKPDSAGWTAYYYHPDANGNIAAVTSPFRALAAKFSYDAFGRTVTQIGSKSGIDIHALNYRFSTKPMELELATSNTTLVPPPVSSGLYYYGYRFYSPNLGRWISRDPIREQGGRNLYNFVGNDGVGKWDLLGLVTFSINIEIRPPDRAFGKKVEASIEASYDKCYKKYKVGTPVVTIHQTYGIPGTGAGDVEVSVTPKSDGDAMIKFEGSAYTRLGQWAPGSGVPFDGKIKFLMLINTNLSSTESGDENSVALGSYSVGHTQYPSFELYVDNEIIYNFHQTTLSALSPSVPWHTQSGHYVTYH